LYDSGIPVPYRLMKLLVPRNFSSKIGFEITGATDASRRLATCAVLFS